MMIKKYLSALLLMLFIGGIVLAPVGNVFAADAKTSTGTDKEKAGSEEPECD